MPLSDKWTRAQLRTAVREEIMDPTGTKAWSWGDAELNQYIDWWQQDLQNEFEFLWGTATAVVGSNTSTLTLTAIATDILRLDGVFGYFPAISTSTKRMVPKTIFELDNLLREWRTVSPFFPLVAYQQDFTTVSFVPAPSTTGTFTFEYPTIISAISTDTTTMVLPAFTKYTAINYVAQKCYQRDGPRHDTQKAEKYKRLHEVDMNQLRLIRDAYQPEKFISLRIGDRYEREILQPNIPITGIST